jgi:hypothetical protein
MRDAMIELNRYCRAWIWALGVLFVGPFLFVAIVAKRGGAALLAQIPHRTIPGLRR